MKEGDASSSSANEWQSMQRKIPLAMRGLDSPTTYEVAILFYPGHLDGWHLETGDQINGDDERQARTPRRSFRIMPLSRKELEELKVVRLSGKTVRADLAPLSG